MVREVLKGMRDFLLLIGIVQVAFAQGFWILLEDMDLAEVQFDQLHEQHHEQGLMQHHGSVERELKGRHSGRASSSSTTNMKPFSTMPLSLLYAYRISLIGEYDPSMFMLFDASHCAPLGYFLFVICTLLLTVVFLNLLISLIGDMFQKVQERQNADAMREQASLLLEEEQLMNRSSIMNSTFFPRYLYVAQHTSARGKEKRREERNRKAIFSTTISRKSSRADQGSGLTKILDAE
jgi:hypothetical protein